MQAVLGIEDIKRVEVGLTRVGVSVSELMHRAGLACAQEVLDRELLHRESLSQDALHKESLSQDALNRDVLDRESLDRDDQNLFDSHSAHVVVFVGLGNNGGDGWVAAEALHVHGISVEVITPIAPSELRGDLVRQVAQSAERAGVTVHVGPSKAEIEALLIHAHVIVDAIFGTGFHGRLTTPFDIWISCINASRAHVIAVDIPSGLSGQSGHADSGCVVADTTITMLAVKPGLISDAGRDVCGSIVVAPLAHQTDRLINEVLPLAWRADLVDYQAMLRKTSLAVDKFSKGSVLVVGGSSRYPGAPVLAAKAAARAGAGYVTVAVPEPVRFVAQHHLLEIPVVGLSADEEGIFTSQAAEKLTELARHMDCVVIGPGMRVSGGTVALVLALLALDVALIIDADGINALARLTESNLLKFPELLRREAPVILTPHRKELSRLFSNRLVDSLADQILAAKELVASDGGDAFTIVTKASATACVSLEETILPKPGSFLLATAGSGDVLSGMLAGTLAQRKKRLAQVKLARLCAFVAEAHAYAAAIASETVGSHAVMASDIVDSIGHAFDALELDVVHAAHEEQAEHTRIEQAEAEHAQTERAESQQTQTGQTQTGQKQTEHTQPKHTQPKRAHTQQSEDSSEGADPHA